MPGSKHDLPHSVDCIQFRPVDLQQAVCFRRQLDLALFRLRCFHIAALTHLTQHLCRIIFMEHPFLLLPHIQMLFPHGEQDRDVLFRDDMPFPEYRVLHHARDDLGNVMAEHAADCIFCSDQFHFISSSSFIHTAAHASLGILQSPLGESATVPIFGPSGRQERLNCWEKNLRQNVFSHFRIVSLS